MNEKEHQHTGECADLLGNLSGLIDGDLSDEMCAQLRQHMAGCRNCRVVYDTTTRTIYMYQHNPAEATLPNGARERLYSKLHLDDLLATKEP